MNKAILHDHLDGGLRPSTALELAKNDSYKPLLEIENISSFFDRSSSNSLEDYLEAFIHTTALMNKYENLERIAFEAAEDMHNCGINLYESRYAPLYSVNENLSIKDVLESINSGFKQAENLYGIQSGLILCGMRNDLKNVESVGEIAVKYKDLIIGFDIAGPELKMHQCGLPRKMALELFKPFVMNQLVMLGYAHNIKSAKRIAEAVKPEVWDILEEVVQNRPVSVSYTHQTLPTSDLV